jgi:hypothetical protein
MSAVPSTAGLRRASASTASRAALTGSAITDVATISTGVNTYSPPPAFSGPRSPAFPRPSGERSPAARRSPAAPAGSARSMARLLASAFSAWSAASQSPIKGQSERPMRRPFRRCRTPWRLRWSTGGLRAAMALQHADTLPDVARSTQRPDLVCPADEVNQLPIEPSHDGGGTAGTTYKQPDCFFGPQPCVSRLGTVLPQDAPSPRRRAVLRFDAVTVCDRAYGPRGASRHPALSHLHCL